MLIRSTLEGVRVADLAVPVRTREAWRRIGYVGNVGLIAIGALLVRGISVLRSDFPLNDGGMFASMVVDLQRNHFRLPDVTSYNHSAIPFAYPPLGFYLAAGLSSLTGASAIEILRIMPLVVSVLSIPAFFLLARAIFPGGTSLIATTVYALLPTSSLWLMMGGGLTRSVGWLFCLLTLWQGYRLIERQNRTALILTGLFAGLTTASHLGFAWAMSCSLAVMWFCLSRSWRVLARFGVAGLLALLLTAPWWLTVISRHGLRVFLDAGQSGTRSIFESLLNVISLTWTLEPFFPVATACALLGAWNLLVHHRPWLPVWLIALLVLDPRQSITDVIIPLSLLASHGFMHIVVPNVRSMLAHQRWGRRWLKRLGMPVIVGVVFAQLLMSAVLVGLIRQASLSPDERAAMAWVSQHTAEDSRFVVVSGTLTWETDFIAEWFPNLAQRQSVTTVQGTEWQAGDLFHRQQAANEALQQCAVQTSACLAQWRDEWGLDFGYVYITKRPPLGEDAQALKWTGEYHWALELALRSDPRYRLVFDGPGAAIFQRTG